MEPILVKELRGYTIEIHADEDAPSPRDDSNVGTLLVVTRSPVKGPEVTALHTGNIDNTVYEDYVNDDILDHIRTSNGARVVLPLREAFDGGYVVDDPIDAYRAKAFYFDTPRNLAECMGEDASDEQITAALKAEIETWNQWVRGEVYGFVINDADGKHVDSAWGFMGGSTDHPDPHDYVMYEAEAYVPEQPSVPTPAKYESLVTAISELAKSYLDRSEAAKKQASYHLASRTQVHAARATANAYDDVRMRLQFILNNLPS